MSSRRWARERSLECSSPSQATPTAATVAVYGGLFMLPLNAANRTQAGVTAGDEVTIALALDTAPRTVSVPPDLATALDADAALRARFNELSYSKQRQYVDSIEEAKTSATRQRRIAAAVAAMRPR